MKRTDSCLTFFALSMLFVAATVKAQDKAASFPDDAGGHQGTAPKGSATSDQNSISKLVKMVMISGSDWTYPNGFAQAVGLDRSMPAKVTMVLVGGEARKCHVIYEPDETASNRPVCVYLVRSKKTKQDLKEQFFRVSLDGRLEMVVTLRNKLDDQGKNLREGRSKVEEDIASPEIRKIFKAEMAFWLKDWLKKQKKASGGASAASGPTAERETRTGARN